MIPHFHLELDQMHVDALYKNLLASLLVTTNDNGELVFNDGEVELPFKVEGKKLILLSNERLRDRLADDEVGFHPLSENATRGESPVLQRLVELVSMRLSTVLSDTIKELVSIAANRDQHSKLSPGQAEFLKILPDADESLVKVVDKVLDRVTIKGDHRLLNLYLKVKGKVEGQEYKRVCTFTLPGYEELCADGASSMFGVTMRKRDVKCLRELFEYILPDADTPVKYSTGTNDTTAPYLHALLSTYIKVASHLNRITKKFKKLFGSEEFFIIDLAWEEGLDDFENMRRVYPAQAGNEGVVVEDPAVVEKAKASKLNSAPRSSARLAAELAASEVAAPPPKVQRDEVVDSRPTRELPSDTIYSEALGREIKRPELQDNRSLRRDRYDRDDYDDRYEREPVKARPAFGSGKGTSIRDALEKERNTSRYGRSGGRGRDSYDDRDDYDDRYSRRERYDPRDMPAASGRGRGRGGRGRI